MSLHFTTVTTGGDGSPNSSDDDSIDDKLQSKSPRNHPTQDEDEQYKIKDTGKKMELKNKTKKTPREKKSKSTRNANHNHSITNISIPYNIAYHIFSYLEGRDLVQLALVCENFKKVAEDESLWKFLFTRKGWKLPSKQEDKSKPIRYTYRTYFLKAHYIHVNDWEPREESSPVVNNKSKIADVFKKKKKDIQVLLMGLDGVGKTVALYQLKMGERIDSVPTVGTVEENFKYQKITFNIVEIGGHKMMHQVWKQYLSNADAILWMVDAGDKHKLHESKQQLHEIDQILHSISRPALLGVLINKIDLTGAVSAHYVMTELDLEHVHFNAAYVQSVSSTTSSKELWAMIDWIYSHMSKLKEK